MVVKKTVCSECDTENNNQPNYCPDCGAEDPWITVPEYRFDTDDLPYVFESSFSDDNGELWEDFCLAYFGECGIRGDDVEGLPDEFPRMKYRFLTVYWAIDQEFEIHGPFMSKSKARKATQNGS